MKKVLSSIVALALASMFSASAMAAPQFLNFPVSGYSPYTAGLVSTVLDHEVPHDLTQANLPFQQPSSLGPYGYSGAVLSFTGELFVATGSYPSQNLGCYPKSSNTHQSSTWGSALQSMYSGTSSDNCTVNVALNYDNHPGYDYKTPGGSAVHPGASGNIIFTKCIKTFTNTGTCESYGAVAVDHGNGFVTQYLHMANLNYGSAASGSNQPVTTSWTLGTVSSVGVTAVHLHFEVLQRKATPVDPNNYYARSNYVIVDPYGYNSSSYYGDHLLSNPGCLWASGCHF